MEELINRQQSLAFHFSGTQAACLPLNSPNIFTVTRSIFEFRTFWSSPVKSCILARSSWGNSTGPRLKKTWDRCRKLKDRYQRLDVIHIQSRQAHGTLFCVTIIPTYSKCWLISLNIYERNFQLIKYILFTIGPVICRTCDDVQNKPQIVICIICQHFADSFRSCAQFDPSYPSSCIKWPTSLYTMGRPKQSPLCRMKASKNTTSYVPGSGESSGMVSLVENPTAQGSSSHILLMQSSSWAEGWWYSRSHRVATWCDCKLIWWKEPGKDRKT